MMITLTPTLAAGFIFFFESSISYLSLLLKSQFFQQVIFYLFVVFCCVNFCEFEHRFFTWPFWPLRKIIIHIPGSFTEYLIFYYHISKFKIYKNNVYPNPVTPSGVVKIKEDKSFGYHSPIFIAINHDISIMRIIMTKYRT